MPSAAARRGRLPCAHTPPARLRRVRRATGKAVRPGPSTRRRQLKLLSRLAPRLQRRRSGAAAAGAGAAGVGGGAAAPAADLPQTVLRNVALEAVRVGNYWAEDQEAVLGYIREQFERLLADRGWLAAEEQDLRQENAFTKRYSVDDILRKRHEADGFNVFVSPEEALLQRQAEELRARGRPAPEPGLLAELQEGLGAAVADGDGVGEEELLELLEGCAGAGEVAAAVFCGGRLLDLGGETEVPGLDRAFEALKRLLRPSAAAPEPQLAGPWCVEGRGPAQAAKAARQGLSRLLSRLAAARKARDSANDAGAAARGAAAEEAERCLRRLGDAVTPLLLGDAEAASCNRRGSLAELLLRLCHGGGLQASAKLAACLVGELERRGVVRTQGRALEVVRASAGQAGVAAEPVAALSGDLERLEAAAQERLQRRRKRQQARQQTRVAKRRRAEGGAA